VTGRLPEVIRQTFRVYEAGGGEARQPRGGSRWFVRNMICANLFWDASFVGSWRVPLSQSIAASYPSPAFHCIYCPVLYLIGGMPLSIRNWGGGRPRQVPLSVDGRRPDADDSAGSARALPADTRRASGGTTGEDLTVIDRRAASLPKRDRRSPDEITGYDERDLRNKW